MGIDHRYCSSCCECLHGDCFRSCKICWELITDSEGEYSEDFLCDNCDGRFKYKHEGKEIYLCYTCNPKFYKGKKKNNRIKKLTK